MALSCRAWAAMPKRWWRLDSALKPNPAMSGLGAIAALSKSKAGTGGRRRWRISTAPWRWRPATAPALNNRGLILRDLGRHDEALASFDALLGARPIMSKAAQSRPDFA